MHSLDNLHPVSTPNESEQARRLYDLAIQEDHLCHQRNEESDRLVRQVLLDQNCRLTSVESEPGWIRLRFDNPLPGGLGVALTYFIS